MSDLFDDDSWDSFGDSCDEKLEKAPVEQTVQSKAIKTRSTRNITRRASSEENYYKMMDWHLEDGATYNIISSGDVDFLTFVRSVIKQQKADYLILSTWCFGNNDAEEIREWVDRGLVKRLDIYTGEVIKQYTDGADTLLKATADTGGRFCVFRNHCKVAVIYGERFNCAISSSANINTNPRTEQAVIQVNTEICDFYKEYFDRIQAFNKEYQPKEWKPWTLGNQKKSN